MAAAQGAEQGLFLVSSWYRRRAAPANGLAAPSSAGLPHGSLGGIGAAAAAAQLRHGQGEARAREGGGFPENGDARSYSMVKLQRYQQLIIRLTSLILTAKRSQSNGIWWPV